MSRAILQSVSSVALLCLAISSCVGEPDEVDAIEELDSEAQLVCTPSCTGGTTCDSSSGCCIGAATGEQCSEKAPYPNGNVVVGAADNPGTGTTVSSPSSYGTEDCDRFTIQYDSVPGVWWDRIEAKLYRTSTPTNKCDCENMEVSLDVIEQVCMGSCAIQGVCTGLAGGPCCSSSSCAEGEHCQGSHPPLCSGVQDVVQQTARGNWTGTFCESTVTVYRADAAGAGFQGKYPYVRAVALDKRTGVKRRVTVTAWND